ncbi:Pyridoxal kinase [Gracilariopsis chorda]|uniref:pyridoxal kinase n=1 Tax=Gracilariopsis chorda TaxID=448386 RepID=A0A2V3J4Q6_9FLOR|nr:Pyridoxal kinase [Gracilariopsis chorda]|eukprot:PXF49364.1 Pyridoxal kinase [Gracilariopsis chorda]
MSDESARRVLSIQSHVTSGYVGNRAAVFPLQLLGYDVDVLNSCVLSNHTGYEHGAPGIRLNAHQLLEILNGMKENHLLQAISHLLTGYIGTASCLHAVADAVHMLRHHSTPNLVYVCDPVLGDNGKLYVPEPLVHIYVHNILHLATILTPNAFELGLLTNSTIASEQHAFSACDYLHQQHKIPIIVVTGTRFHPDCNKLSVLVSSRSKHNASRFAIDVQYIDAHFTGTGDLMTALLLAWFDKFPHDPVQAVARATASVSAVLANTAKLPKSQGLAPFPELRLIQSQSVIVDPPMNLVNIRLLSDPPQ